MVTREALCLARDKFPDEVGKKTFLLLLLDGFLFNVAHANRYLPRGGKGEFPEFRILLEILRPSLELFLIKECIPVGCVLPAH